MKLRKGKQERVIKSEYFMNITNSIEQSPSWEASKSSAGQ
jgi:hypothetical protein